MAHSIVLVDDHDVVRGGLQFLIEDDSDYVVTAQFNNGRELLQMLPNLYPQPDVIILDLDMPIMNGRETLVELKNGQRAYQVLILTIAGDDETVLDMVRIGARGFLPKYCSRQELKTALNNIIKYGYYHSELEVNVLHQSVLKETQPPKKGSVGSLSKREIEFIRLVCDKRELSYKQIASEMNVAFRTIDGYRESVFFKLDIKTKLGLVFYALRNGIVKFEEIIS